MATKGVETIKVKFDNSVDVSTMKDRVVCLGVFQPKDGDRPAEYQTCYLTREQVVDLIALLGKAII